MSALRGWGMLLIMLGSLAGAQGAEIPRVGTAAGAPGVSGGGGSFTPVISGDGRFVAFVSQANNLVTNDNQGPCLDVFVRDLLTQSTKLVSVNRSGHGGGDGNSNFPTISSRGQFIAFESTAGNLVDDDTNGVSDVFVREMVSGTTLLVSVNEDGTGSGNGASIASVITPDGLWVAFESAATNLVADDTNGLSDVFVRDLLTGTTYLASVGVTGTNQGFRSEAPAITPDARRVAFATAAPSSYSGVLSLLGEIYVRDLERGVTFWASTNVSSLISPDHRCLNPVISDDGRTVVFKVITNYYSTVFVCRQDLDTGATTILSSNSIDTTWPAISADGRYTAFETLGACGLEIWRYDAQTGSNTLVSVDVSGAVAGSGDAIRPIMTPDGAKIAFLFSFVPKDSAYCFGGPLTTNMVNNQYQLFLRDIPAQTTRLISSHPDGTGGSDSLENIVPTLSADGTRVAFESLDSRLVSEDRNQASDVFVYSAPSASLQLASQRHSTLPAQTSLGLSYLSPNSLSADGRYVVFSALDGNVVPNDTNGLPDVFVRDLFTGSNVLVSVRTNSPMPMIGLARDPVVSANGRFVAFVHSNSPSGAIPRRSVVLFRDLLTQSTSLITSTNDYYSNPSISGDGRYVAYSSRDVYVFDTQGQTNLLVSVNVMGSRTGDGPSYAPLMSRDGRWVVFQSKASDLTTNAVNTSVFQLYARDLAANRTLLLSPASSTGDAQAAAFSASGQLVLFTADSGKAYVFDLLAETNALLCSSCANPTISGDGSWAAYEVTNTYSGIHQIALKAIRGGATQVITASITNLQAGNGHSVSPTLSYDGRYVVYASKASDLVPNDTNNCSDIFVYDRVLGQTLLVSLNVLGGPGQGTSAKPILGADGRSILFQSFAPDLSSGDYNFSRDTFVLRLSSGDSDTDGMDDDWEWAYFGSLARDGSGDFDRDGLTDLQEFQGGTDPTNEGSVLRVFTLTSLGTGQKMLLWAAVPGQSYYVQYTTNLAEAVWTELPGPITAATSTASYVDGPPGADSQRYYRVVLARGPTK